MMAGLLDMYFPAEDPMAPADLVPAGLLNGDGSRALNKARGLLAEQPGYAYGSILPFKRDTATGDLSFAIPGFARDSATGILDMLEGKMTPEASMALLDIPIGGLLHAGVTGARQTPDTLAAIRAYHGSPHRFDRFDMSKIGTGEGAQAYGHGLYFAEAPGVAKSYKDTLTRYSANIGGKSIVDAYSDGTLNGLLVEKLGMSRGEAVEAGYIAADHVRTNRPISEIVQDRIASVESLYGPGELAQAEAARLTKLGAALEGATTPPAQGALYTAKLNVEPDDLLDWDLPLSQQSEKVKAAVEGRVKEYRKVAPETMPEDPTGQQIYRAFFPQKFLGDAEAGMATKLRDLESRKLMEAGIPGIRYLDQGSRGAGEGTRNFVIFDDKLIDIEGVQ